MEELKVPVFSEDDIQKIAEGTPFYNLCFGVPCPHPLTTLCNKCGTKPGQPLNIGLEALKSDLGIEVVQSNDPSLLPTTYIASIVLPDQKEHTLHVKAGRISYT